MTPDPYHYEAGNVGGNTWMVKRWTTDPDDYTEALITIITIDPEDAIRAAIERGSWA